MTEITRAYRVGDEPPRILTSVQAAKEQSARNALAAQAALDQAASKGTPIYGKVRRDLEAVARGERVRRVGAGSKAFDAAMRRGRAIVAKASK